VTLQKLAATEPTKVRKLTNAEKPKSGVEPRLKVCLQLYLF